MRMPSATIRLRTTSLVTARMAPADLLGRGRVVAETRRELGDQLAGQGSLSLLAFGLVGDLLGGGDAISSALAHRRKDLVAVVRRPAAGPSC